MEYVCVDARFKFFDGKNQYTVEYTYGLSMWFVFEDDKDTDAVYEKTDKSISLDEVNQFSAENILYKYLKKNKKL